MSNTVSSKSYVLRAAPLLFSILGAVVFGLMGLWAVWSVTDPMRQLIAFLAFASYVLWFLWESRISVDELGKDYEDHAKGTMEFAFFSKSTVLAAAYLGGTSTSLWLMIMGMAIMLVGMAFRMGAIVALGSDYSHRIRQPKWPLKRAWPYNIVRHPSYFGTLVLHTGYVLVYFNVFSVMSLVLLWWSAVVLRTVREDHCLMQWPDYRDYAKRVKNKLIPYVW